MRKPVLKLISLFTAFILAFSSVDLAVLAAEPIEDVQATLAAEADDDSEKVEESKKQEESGNAEKKEENSASKETEGNQSDDKNKTETKDSGESGKQDVENPAGGSSSDEKKAVEENSKTEDSKEDDSKGETLQDDEESLEEDLTLDGEEDPEEDPEGEPEDPKEEGDEETETKEITVEAEDIVCFPEYYEKDGKYTPVIFAVVKCKRSDFERNSIEVVSVQLDGEELEPEDLYDWEVYYLDFYGRSDAKKDNSDYMLLKIIGEAESSKANLAINATIEVAHYPDRDPEFVGPIKPVVETRYTVGTTIKLAGAPKNDAILVTKPFQWKVGEFFWGNLPVAGPIETLKLKNSSGTYPIEVEEPSLFHGDISWYYPLLEIESPDGFYYEEHTSGEGAIYRIGGDELQTSAPSGTYDLIVEVGSGEELTAYTYKNAVELEGATALTDEQVLVQDAYYKDWTGHYRAIWYLAITDAKLKDRFHLKSVKIDGEPHSHIAFNADSIECGTSYPVYWCSATGDFEPGEHTYDLEVTVNGKLYNYSGKLCFAEDGIEKKEHVVDYPSFPRGKDESVYPYFSLTLANGEKFNSKPQLVLQENKDKVFAVDYWDVLWQDSISTEQDVYRYEMKVGDDSFEIPEDMHFKVVVPVQSIRARMSIPYDDMPSGVYDLVLTSNLGKEYIVKNVIDVEKEKAVLTSVKSAGSSKYTCDPASDYVAIVVYGLNLGDDIIPQFYADKEFTKKAFVYDASDDNCAKSPNLGDGRIYKVRKSADFVTNGILYCKLNKEDAIYAGYNVVDPESGKTVGLENSFALDPAYRIVYSNTSEKKIFRAYLSSMLLDKEGLTTGDIIPLYVDEWKSGRTTRVSYIGALEKDETGAYYVEVPSSEPVHSAFGREGCVHCKVGDTVYSFIRFDTREIKVLDNLSVPSGNWRIISASDMATVLASGIAGTNVLGSAELAQLSKESNVLVEITDKDGKIQRLYEACFKSATYDTVTYVDDGEYEDFENPIYLEKGEKVKLLEPTREHYSFDGWYTTENFAPRSKVTELTGKGGQSVTLYAKWTGIEYTIWYCSGGSKEGKTVKYGENFSLYSTGINYVGHIRDGWSIVDGGEKVFEQGEITDVGSLLDLLVDNGIIVENNEINVYAVWLSGIYSINYHTEGADIDTTEYPKSYEYSTEKAVELPVPEETISGFTFGGWFTERECENAITQIEARSEGDVDVYAKWIPTKCTVKYDSNIASYPGLKLTSAKTMNDSVYSYGEVITLGKNVFTVAPTDSSSKTKYVFKGWSVTPKDPEQIYGENTKCTVEASMAEDGVVTFYAIYDCEFAISYAGIKEDSVISGELIERGYIGENYTLPNVTLAGYDFLGWYDSATGKKTTSFKVAKPEDKEFTAMYKEKTYKVKLNANGGKGTAVTVDVPYTGSVYLGGYTDYTKAGYTLGGWALDKEPTTPITNFKPSAYGDVFGKTGSTITVKAIWNPENYTVKYHVNGGTPLADKVFPYSETEQAVAVPERTGFTFGGWYLDEALKKSAGKYTASTNTATLKKGTTGNEENEIHLYAKWNGSYSVVLYGPNLEVKVYDGYKNGSIKALPGNPFSKENNCLAGWSTTGFSDEAVFSDKEKISGCEAIAYSDELQKNVLKLYAIWRPQQMIFDGNGGTIRGEKQECVEYETGTSYSFEYLSNDYCLPDERPGYQFDGWYLDKGGKKPAELKNTDKGDITFYAKWSGEKYYVHFYPVVNVMLGTMPTQTMTAGKATALTKNKFKVYADSMAFLGWAVSPGGEVVYTDGEKITDSKWISENSLDLFAVWKDGFDITFDKNADDAVDGRVTTYHYAYGLEVKDQTFAKISVPTRPGYAFAGWYTDESCKKAFKKITKTQTGDFTLYAKWVPATYTITFHVNAPENMTVKGNMKQQKLTYFKSTAISKCSYQVAGHEFAGWALTPDGEVVIENAEKISTLSGGYPEGGNLNLYAKWTPVEYKIILRNMDGFDYPGETTYYSISGKTLENPEKLGYIFQGWYLDKGFRKPITEIKVGTTGDVTIYAKWVKRSK